MTLYVGEYGPPEGIDPIVHEPILVHRPATHDELIAAMPRCGTCARRSEEAEWELYYCPVGGYVSASFGCTEHKVSP